MKILKIRPAFSNIPSAMAFLLFSVALFASPFFLNAIPGIRQEIFRFPQTENADLQFWREQLYVEKSDLDWVFIGPCTVWWHIHPDVIEKEIYRQTGNQIQALTFGYNHFSPEVSLLLAEELLKNRHVKNIVLPTPRFGDTDRFPHPDSHYWWLYGEDFSLLNGLGPIAHFKLYSATVAGSIRNLARVFQAPNVKTPDHLVDNWGTRIRSQLQDAPLKARALKVKPTDFIYQTQPAGSLVELPLSFVHRQIFLATILSIQSRGTQVWLLNSPLKEDFQQAEIRERENWSKLLNHPPPLIGISPKWVREVYSEEEISGFFQGENLTVTASRIWSQWIGQAIGSTYVR